MLVSEIQTDRSVQGEDRNMKKLLLITVGALVVMAAAALLVAQTAPPVFAADSEEGGSTTVYLCGCEEGCSCKAASAKPGKCGCGKELVAHTVIELSGNIAKICGCGDGCDCGKSDAKDATKCNCGKDLKTVDLTGTGLYACDCGPTYCRVVSDKPGDCNCGKALKKH